MNAYGTPFSIAWNWFECFVLFYRNICVVVYVSVGMHMDTWRRAVLGCRSPSSVSSRCTYLLSTAARIRCLRYALKCLLWSCPELGCSWLSCLYERLNCHSDYLRHRAEGSTKNLSEGLRRCVDLSSHRLCNRCKSCRRDLGGANSSSY